MAEQLTGPEHVMDILDDRKWRWIHEHPSDRRLAAAKNILSIVSTPTEPGYRPRPYSDGKPLALCEAEFAPMEGFEDGVRFLGYDVYGSFGRVSAVGDAAGRSAIAFVVHWPLPEFMTAGPETSDLFIRTMAEGERVNLLTI